MEGLSDVCQYPRCAKKARFCCDRCMKRTYCSEGCQQLDWEQHKTQCFINEQRKEIMKDFDKLKEEYGSVFPHRQSTKRQNTERPKSTKKSHKQEKKVEVDEEEVTDQIAYKGCLLPFCLETVNNLLIDFFDKLKLNKSYRSMCLESKESLYQTSSISETVEILQNVIIFISKKERNEKYLGVEVGQTPAKIREMISNLCGHFHYDQMKQRVDHLSLYSSANDYKCKTAERKFCTHCGDSEVNLFPHPKLLYIYLCKSCLDDYNDNSWKKEVDDHDTDCICCGDGGNVVLCDFCCHSQCANCIMLHMGDKEWDAIQTGDAWKCMMCKKDENGHFIFNKES